MIVVDSVEAVADFGLLLTFKNGERRRFDMRLDNPAYFSLVRVDCGTVTGPGDIDIAPETLYDRSVPLMN